MSMTVSLASGAPVRPVRGAFSVVRVAQRFGRGHGASAAAAAPAPTRASAEKYRRGGVCRRATSSCGSAEVSLATSAFVAATVATLVARRGPRDWGNALFLGVFGSMQVVDALLWLEDAGPGLEACTLENKLVTRAGLLIIALEPVAALLGTCLSSRTRPEPAEALLYTLLFVLTPLAGTSYAPGDPLACEAGASAQTMCAPASTSSPSLSSSSWGNVLLAVDNQCACTAKTPEGHLLYGGQDLFYSRVVSWPGVDPVRRWVLTEWDAARGGRWATQEELATPPPLPIAVVEASREIPLVLRLAYLVSMAAPYAAKVRPRACGASHAAILVGTWCVGALSDSHASVWCLANVAQGMLMLADPYLWPAPAGVEAGAREAVSRVPFDDVRLARAEPRRLYRRRDHANSAWDAIVVGSGIGGLATAALLARAGKRVLVLEQHYRPGGCSHEFTELGGVPFDSGIHYVGGSPLMRRMLDAVCSPDLPVRMAPLGSEDDGYLYDLIDLGRGSGVPAVAYRRGWRALEAELVARWPEEADAIRGYLVRVRDSGRATDGLMASKFLPPGPFPGRERLVRALSGPSERLGGGSSAKAMVEACVRDPKLRAVLAAGQLIDYNLPPDRASWLVVAGMMNYYAAHGGFYPEGGSQRMVGSVARVIEAAGGQVLCRAPVERIILDEGEGQEEEREVLKRRRQGPRARGVQLANGDRIEAPIVVSAAGYATTFERFLSGVDLDALGYPAIRPSDVLAPSHAHVCAFVTLDGDPRDLGLSSANIHSFGSLPRFGYDVDAMQAAWYADPLCGSVDAPLITLTCPCMKDYASFSRRFPGTANLILLAEGLDAWFPNDSGSHGHRSEVYRELKARFEPLFLARLYEHYPLARGRVRRLDLSTPRTSAHFLGAPSGGSYGLEWTPAHFDRDLQDHWFQPATKVSGLFLSGEAVCFGGLYGALAGGWAAAAAILGLPATSLMLLSRPVAPVPRKRPNDP